MNQPRASKPVIWVRFPAGPPLNSRHFTAARDPVNYLVLPSWQQKRQQCASTAAVSPFMRAFRNSGKNVRCSGERLAPARVRDDTVGVVSDWILLQGALQR